MLMYARHPDPRSCGAHSERAAAPHALRAAAGSAPTFESLQLPRRWLLLWALCAYGVGCTPRANATEPADESTVVLSAGSVAAAVHSGPSATGRDAPPVRLMTQGESAAGQVTPRTSLPKFFTALHGLQTGQRDTHVRIAWFGDSHTAADFLTGTFRQLLQRRFGDGGPGFVHVGISDARHDDVRTRQSGRWRREPATPTAFAQQDDGIFGLGGLRAHGDRGRAVLRPAGPSGVRLGWELVLRPTADGARVVVSGPDGELAAAHFSGRPPRAAADSGLRTRASQLLSLGFHAMADTELVIATQAVDLFGAIGERAQPGVIVDALGINGARIRTMLAWQEGSWLGELAEREPQLVVLAFGSNEAGDAVAVERYAEDYRNVVARVSAAVPEAECLLLGPTDRGKGQELAARRAGSIDQMQREVASELGCAYFSIYEAMGGPGGFIRWAQHRPSLTSGDGVHLTAAGYRRWAELLVEELLQAYAAR